MGPLIPSQGVSGWLPGEGLKEKWVGGGGAERQGKGRCRQKEQHMQIHEDKEVMTWLRATSTSK